MPELVVLEVEQPAQEIGDLLERVTGLGARLELEVTFHGGRKYLPSIAIRRAA